MIEIMSQNQRQLSPEEQLNEQAQAVIQEFQVNFSVANKPLNDLVKSFSAYIQITNARLRLKDDEIQRLRGQVVKSVNKDVALPPVKDAKAK